MPPKSVPHAVFKSILQKKNNKHGNIIDSWLMLLNYNKIFLRYTVNPPCETWHPISDHQSKTPIFGSFLLLWKDLSLSLCSAEVLTGVPSGANRRPPCVHFQALRSFPTFRAEGRGGDFLNWLTLQHIRGREFFVNQVLVYNVSGGTEHI